MDNLIQYLKYRKDITFKQERFNEIDALVFSVFVYFEFEGIVSNDKTTISMQKACKVYLEKHSKEEIEAIFLFCPTLVCFIEFVSSSDRYKEVSLSNYEWVNDKDEITQFAAMTYHLPSNEVFIAYRGTDNSILGWQENVKMLYQNEVVSYKRAVDYVRSILVQYKNGLFNKYHFYIGGHSKGGNLAMAAYLKLNENQKRIVKVYSFDGPGFKQAFLDLNHTVYHKVIEYCPRASIVGRVFEHVGKVVIIDSNEEGLLQHDPLCWKMDGNGFIVLNQFDDLSNETNDFFNQLIYCKDVETQKRYASILENILGALEIERLVDIKEIKLQKAFHGMKEFTALQGDEKKFILSVLKYFIGQSKSTLFKK